MAKRAGMGDGYREISRDTWGELSFGHSLCRTGPVLMGGDVEPFVPAKKRGAGTGQGMGMVITELERAT